MKIGVPTEAARHENRVALTPYAVARLVERENEVVIRSGAGEAAHFSDDEYRKVGGEVVYSDEEIYHRPDLIVRVGAPGIDDLSLFPPGATVCAFHHLAVSSSEMVQRYVDLEATLIGYEVIRDESDGLRILDPIGEMAGQLAVHIAGHLLQNVEGGRGILLGTVPGVPPPTVLVLGAGTVGRTAAKLAAASGAHVIVFDEDRGKLRSLSYELGGSAVTMTPSHERLSRFTAIADVVIGAVLIPGARAPFLVTEEMVKQMKSGSVVMDISIDQGGCIETSRPTTPEDPTFVYEGVTHYCVPNMTSGIARTASRALSDCLIPLVESFADRGLAVTLLGDPSLAAGVYMYRGKIVSSEVADLMGVEPANLEESLAGEA